MPGNALGAVAAKGDDLAQQRQLNFFTQSPQIGVEALPAFWFLTH
jgi:hypothetical protein